MIRFNGHFALALRREMKSAGLSAADVARKLGVGRFTVYGWLSGVEPASANMAKLIQLFPALAGFAR